MSVRVRAARLAGVAVLALLLTGCIKLNMNLGINSDDTVSGSIQVGVQKELLELSGQSVDDLLGTAAPIPTDAPGVSVEPFDDGEFAGQEITFDALPIAQFNQQATGATGPGEALHIAREGDTFVVTGVMDLSGGITGATGFGATAGAALFESAEIRIAITFPGDVIEAPGGQVDGNTVTYVPRFGERLEINATGSAIDDGDAGAVGAGDGGSNLLLYLIIAGAVVVLAVVVFLVVRSRRGAGGGGAGTGFEPTPAAAPPMAAPPPAPPAVEPPPPAMPPGTPPPPPPSEP